MDAYYVKSREFFENEILSSNINQNQIELVLSDSAYQNIAMNMNGYIVSEKETPTSVIIIALNLNFSIF